MKKNKDFLKITLDILKNIWYKRNKKDGMPTPLDLVKNRELAHFERIIKWNIKLKKICGILNFGAVQR